MADKFSDEFRCPLRGLAIDGYATRHLHPSDLHMSQDRMFRELEVVLAKMNVKHEAEVGKLERENAELRGRLGRQQQLGNSQPRPAQPQPGHQK